MHPVRLGARPAGPFYAPAADPGLPYRRVHHWSIRHGLGRVQESITVISELGLIFMLFMIGLEIDLKKIVRAGKVILFAAGGQLIGGVAARSCCSLSGSGCRWAAAISTRCISASPVRCRARLSSSRCCTRSASSTRCPAASPLGVLVLQDIFAILFLAVQPSLDNLQVSVILISIGRVGVLVATALVLSRYVLPRLFHQIARAAGTGPARRTGLVLPDRRDRREAASVARDGLAGGAAFRCRHSSMRSTSPPR